MCSATATNIQLKLLDCCHFTTSEFKPTCPFLSLKQVHFPFSSFSLKTKISPCKIVPFVAQTSDLAQTQLEKEEEESGTEYDEGIEAINSVDEGTEAVKSIDNGGEESYRTATVFVGNLYYDVDSKQLAELFTQAGTVEICEVMYNRDTGQSRGFGFVTMSSFEEAEKAIEMFKLYKLHGRLLTVQKAAPRGTLPGAYSRGELYRVFVGNLPRHVDDVRLEQLFSEHGKVLKARVVYDHYTGTSRGFGFVTMSSEAELNAAVFALDGEDVDGQLLRVSVAHEIGGRVI